MRSTAFHVDMQSELPKFTLMNLDLQSCVENPYFNYASSFTFVANGDGVNLISLNDPNSYPCTPESSEDTRDKVPCSRIPADSGSAELNTQY